MPADVFFDTNVLIYAISQNDARAPRAEALLATGGRIGVQTLNEFVAVTRRKFGMSWNEVNAALDAIVTLCPDPVPIKFTTHEAARKIAENLGYGIYDALIAAAALQARCSILFSEDFQDGQVIEGKLTIQNPFR